MALNIKNSDVELLAARVANLTGETKTEAIRRALEEREVRLRLHVVPKSRAERAFSFLEREVWPHLPPGELGQSLTKEEQEEILGLGPHGV